MGEKHGEVVKRQRRCMALALVFFIVALIRFIYQAQMEGALSANAFSDAMADFNAKNISKLAKTPFKIIGTLAKACTVAITTGMVTTDLVLASIFDAADDDLEVKGE